MNCPGPQALDYLRRQGTAGSGDTKSQVERPIFQVRPLARAVWHSPHPLRGLLILYAFWIMAVGVPVFFGLGIGVNLLTIVSGVLAVLVGLTVVLEGNGAAAMSFAVPFEELHAAAQGRPQRRSLTWLRAHSERLLAVAVGVVLVVNTMDDRPAGRALDDDVGAGFDELSLT